MIQSIVLNFTEVTQRFQRPGAQVRNVDSIVAKVERQAVADGPFNIEAELPLNEAERKEFLSFCDRVEARLKTEVTA